MNRSSIIVQLQSCNANTGVGGLFNLRGDDSELLMDEVHGDGRRSGRHNEGRNNKNGLNGKGTSYLERYLGQQYSANCGRGG
jgi:hypothetical protein